MVMFQLIGMSSYAKNKLQLCSVNQHLSPKVGKLFIDSPSTIKLCLLKNDLSSLNNLFMEMFQLIRISSYAKNKLHLCSVTQH